jgi:hypothetical protein
MFSLLLSFLVGIGVLASLYLLGRRPRVEGGAETLIRARTALDALQGSLLPPETVDRLFARSDYEYVAGTGSEEVRKVFIDERKRVALLWVSQVLQQIRGVKAFHLGAARFYSRLSLRTELRVAADFFVLLAACRMLQAAIYLRGPYAAPRMVGRVAGVATTVCATSEEAMNFMKPVKIERLTGESARNTTAL